ncbi:hypothetical protein L3X38_001420 [Prunus dulcis]|uniref:ENTH domain-containing protein n=1 Tax=Prunus dulcis TaxID=3755 RepID=A0AAD4ZKB8_PRUDU|nr:hypothetical protein L3X38_001420 [Prunus dulcis]
MNNSPDEISSAKIYADKICRIRFPPDENIFADEISSGEVGLIKVNSEFKDLDITTVKATSHVECPPKERHVRNVAYCIHAPAKRLSKTRSWIVAIKTFIVVHRTLREGPSL